MRLLHVSTAPALTHFPGELRIALLGAGQMSPLPGILHCCMLHTPLINIAIICVARSVFVLRESERSDNPVGLAHLPETCLHKGLRTIPGENST